MPRVLGFLLLAAVGVGGLLADDPVVPAAAPQNTLPPVDFRNDIEPLLSRYGCNAGGCHGKASGQNGFKLSLFGFDVAYDYAEITQRSRGRRVFPAAPEKSLLLQKAVNALPHGGGKRFEVDSE